MHDANSRPTLPGHPGAVPELGITLAAGAALRRTERGIAVPLALGSVGGRVGRGELTLDERQARRLYADLGQFLGEETGSEAGRCAR
ncbi:hypothetical protein RKE29_12385 [Streptomyces sp. B1866]|uniref:hypothetical protein n=1 Tax=Streptomyces sp. B1866 TaxID=3075431 RepID=UPI00288ED27B|nr:hypothetical protein [Streptomyces sp. B1866]MDT3397437.1 hypothetical protein [Streptomyces sp. B1866]